MNFYSFHIGDYAAHTRRLSLMEDLAYRRLLDEYYLQEAPLVGEPAVVARQIGMPDHVEAVGYVLGAYFDGNASAWINKRCDREIQKYLAMSTGGKSGAEKRWARHREAKENVCPPYSPPIGEVIAPLNTPYDPPNANHKPITNISSLRSDSARDVSKSEKAKRACQLPADFAPGDDHRALAAELGLSLDREWSKFADHHRARGTVFKDWDAALRTWLRKSLDFGTKPGPASAPMPPAALAASKEAHKVFVEEGSEDWFAWKAVRKTIPVVDCRLADGQIKRGWHFPSSRPETAAGGGFL